MKWEALQKQIKGTVTTAKDSNFKALSHAMVWNKVKPHRKPACIVSVKDEDDVIKAIRFASQYQLKVSVHGGGHTWCGLAIREDGMTIDLNDMTHSSIDPKTATASIQPVISNRELAKRLQAYNLAFPIGHCPTVKESGYLLSGGMSWNLSHWGPGCLSVKKIELITADGKQLIASDDEHPDLFWASRGCGPGMFAVATRFHLNCYPLPQSIMTSTYYFSLNNLREVLEDIIPLGRNLPSIVEMSVFLLQAPIDLADACKDMNGKVCMVTAVAFADTKEQGVSALSLLETGKSATQCLAKQLYERSHFEKLSDLSGALWPENHRNLCENQSSHANPVDIIMAMRDRIVCAPSKKSVILFCQSTGQQDLLRPYSQIAFSMEGKSYGGIWSIWENTQDDAVNIKWHEDTMALLAPYTHFHYIGETDIVQYPNHIQTSYTPEKWNKLQVIREKYDPEHLFAGFYV
jgi:FAD/FMN-containing dehydrogenase